MSSRVSTIYSRIVSEKMVSTNTSKISELNCFQLVNSESVPYPYSYVYTTILIVILLYAIPVNIILIVGTCKTPAKFTTSQKLFLLQSVSDLLTTLITMPVIIYVINFGQKITCVLSAIQVFTFCFTPWTSGCIISIMSLTRYIALSTKELKNLLNRQPRSSTLLTLLIGLFYATSVSVWCTMSYYYKLGILLALFFITSGTIAMMLLITVLSMNVRLVYLLRKNTNKSNVKTTAYQLKVTQTIFKISVATGFCYAPIILVWFFSAYFYLYEFKHKVIPMMLNSWSQILVFMNCGIGPSIYVYSSSLLKRLRNKTREIDDRSWKNFRRSK